MKKYHAFLICLLSIFLHGCSTAVQSQAQWQATVTAEMTLWEGRTQVELIASWGPPTQTTTDGSTGQILIYETFRSWHVAGSSRSWTDVFGITRGVHTSPREGSNTIRKMFYVDVTGVIYRWLVQVR